MKEVTGKHSSVGLHNIQIPIRGGDSLVHCIAVPVEDFGYQDGAGQGEGELDLYYNSRPRGQEKPSRRRRKNWDDDR